MKLTTHLHLVLRSRMYGAISPLPQYSYMVWCLVKAQGQLYFYLARGGKIVKNPLVSIASSWLEIKLIPLKYE